MSVRRQLVLCLVLGVACEDLREFRLEAEPPVDVMQIGWDDVRWETPFLYPIPKRMRSEPEPSPTAEWKAILAPRFVEILVRDQDQHETLYRFQKIFRYPAARSSFLTKERRRPQGWMDVELPGIGTQGDLWVRASGPRFRLCSPSKGRAMTVRHPLTAKQFFHPTGAPGEPMSTSGTMVEQVVPGTKVFSTESWRVEMELPEDLTVFLDQGQGRSDFLHVSYPKSLRLRLGKDRSRASSEWVHGRHSLLDPVLEEPEDWTTSLLRYGSDGEAVFDIHLPGNKRASILVRPRHAQDKAPPLLLAITLKIR